MIRNRTQEIVPVTLPPDEITFFLSASSTTATTALVVVDTIEVTAYEESVCIDFIRFDFCFLFLELARVVVGPLKL